MAGYGLPITYGIGQGLDNFASAYQTAMNYRLEKAKAAQMAQYQQSMADVANKDAIAKLLEAGGSPAVDMYMPGASKSGPSDDTGPAQAPAPPPQGLLNSQPGLLPKTAAVNPLPSTGPASVGPQPSPGLIAASQQNQIPQGIMGMPSVTAPTNPLLNNKTILAPYQRTGMLAAQKEAADKTNESKVAGTNITYEVDPNNPYVTRVASMGQKSGDALLKQQQTQAQIAGETAGSRSPNATLTGQYDDRPAVKSARGSQVAMSQMIDNYNNPSPQGDASLVLNAFKIKFPNQATDVNSIKELEESQAVPDQWKQTMSQAVEGRFDQNTRDNLMRDGISTYRANVGSLRGEQQKFSKRAAANNVQDKSFLEEPAVDQTYADAMSLQKNLGPYVSPSQRQNPGVLSRTLGLLTGNSSQPAAASASKMPPPGLSFEQFKAWKKANAQ